VTVPLRERGRAAASEQARQRKTWPKATAMTVMTASAPSEPTKEIKAFVFIANSPATKKVLSPNSERNISENACVCVCAIAREIERECVC
jgi:hypothetical protein